MFNVKVFIKPEETFSYYKEHRKELCDKMEVIAETAYDDMHSKCYLFLTEDSGNAFISLESSDTIIDSEYLTEDNVVEVVRTFLSKLDKMIPLLLVKAQDALPNESKFRGTITERLDEMLLNKTRLPKTYIYKSFSLGKDQLYSIRIPGRTVGFLRINSQKEITKIKIDERGLRFFEEGTNQVLDTYRGYVLEVMNQ